MRSTYTFFADTQLDLKILASEFLLVIERSWERERGSCCKEPSQTPSHDKVHRAKNVNDTHGSHFENLSRCLEPSKSLDPVIPSQIGHHLIEMAERLRGRRYDVLKYFLMSSNAFGVMIGIFLVLFGMSYPKESFPGGYQGKETAAIAGVFILFTLIGYCGVSCIRLLFVFHYFVIKTIFLSLVDGEDTVREEQE